MKKKQHKVVKKAPPAKAQKTPPAKAQKAPPKPVREKKLPPVLSKSELAHYRQKLVAKREDLLTGMQRAEQEEKQLDEAGEVKDAADLASDAYEREFTNELTDAERRSVGQIESALERMKTGEYGRCVTCGKKIPKIRLEAMPSAWLCINCQTQLEQKKA